MNNPLVSVIMPAYNAAKYIEEAINSVVDQTYIHWELIIINDGSNDYTKRIAEKYAFVDTRIKLIDQENKGLSAARNTGIKNARGEWIAFLDADDIWIADKLKKQLLIAEAEQEAGVIFTDGFIFENDSLKTARPYGVSKGNFTPSAMYKLEYEGNYIPVLSAIIKKMHIDNVGFQDEQLLACEDWDYWLRLAINGVSFYGMSEKLFYYRKHSSNMSNDNNLMRLAKATVFIKNFRKDLLSKEEVIKINGFIKLTICSFIKLGKIKEALFLNNSLHNISKARFCKLSTFLINTLGNRSYYLVRIIFKTNSLLRAY